MDPAKRLGVGTGEQRTLEVGLKEQEGIFRGEEIKAGPGRGRQGASGTGNGMCRATRERENLARLQSSTPKRLTPRSCEGGAGGALSWDAGVEGSPRGQRGKVFAHQPKLSGLYLLDSGEPRQALSRRVT